MWKLQVQNIGGIEQGQVTLDRGTNVIQASNFQGKSSLLAAVQTAIGTTGLGGADKPFDERHPLTEGRDTGQVALEREDATHEVQLLSRDGTVVREGTPVLTDHQDQVIARLFAVLGEDNPIRRAVRSGQTEILTELLTMPLELENIDARVEELRHRRDRLSTRRGEIKTATRDIPQLEEEIATLEDDLTTLQDRHDRLTAEVETDDQQATLREQLSEQEAALDRKKTEIERMERQLQRKRDRLATKEDELDEINLSDKTDLEVDLSEKQDEIDRLEAEISILRDLYNGIDRALTDDHLDILTEVDRTLTEDRLQCWACGAETTPEAVRSQLQVLNQRRSDLLERKEQLEAEVEGLREQRRQRETRQRKHEQLSAETSQLRQQIEDQEQDLSLARERRDELERAVEDLKAEINRLEDTDANITSELREVERTIGKKENALARKQAELEEAKEKAEELEQVESKLATTRDELQELKSRRQTKQTQLQQQYTAALDEIADQFMPGFDGGRLKRITTEDGNTKRFEIVVAQNGRQRSLDTLSEGELELVGIAVALAGYRTFDVSKSVPCLLIDGIGQLASEHLRNLIEYLEGSTDRLITTAYPEAGTFDTVTISPDQWQTTATQTSPTS